MGAESGGLAPRARGGWLPVVSSPHATRLSAELWQVDAPELVSRSASELKPAAATTGHDEGLRLCYTLPHI